MSGDAGMGGPVAHESVTASDTALDAATGRSDRPPRTVGSALEWSLLGIGLVDALSIPRDHG